MVGLLLRNRLIMIIIKKDHPSVVLCYQAMIIQSGVFSHLSTLFFAAFTQCSQGENNGSMQVLLSPLFLGYALSSPKVFCSARIRRLMLTCVTVFLLGG